MASGQRVQHHVDPFAAGRRQQLVIPVEGVRIECRAHSQRTQLLALTLAAGRGVDLRSHVLRKSDRRLADAAHSRVEQHPLAFAQAREMHQRIVGGNVNRQDRRGLLHGEGRGFAEHQIFFDHGAIGDATALGKSHGFTGAAGTHSSADAAHDPAGLHPHRAAQRRAFVGE